MLPVFHNRNIVYPYFTIRAASGIRQDHPEDLKGKRMALGYYEQTAALWSRGILLHEFGVTPEDIEWYEAPGRYIEHGGVAAHVPTPGLKCQIAPKDAPTMLREGTIDGALSFRPTGDPAFPTLFADPKAEAIRFRQKWGFLPAHHTTIVRESILEQHPWVATSLVTAFNEAKQLAAQRLAQRPPTLLLFASDLMQEMEGVFGKDPWAYGLRANAKMVDTAQTFSMEQALTKRKQPLDEMVAEEVLVSEDWKPRQENVG
jgi:4,5-dihydroxyphthalate decarboxylase